MFNLDINIKIKPRNPRHSYYSTQVAFNNSKNKEIIQSGQVNKLQFSLLIIVHGI